MWTVGPRHGKARGGADKTRSKVGRQTERTLSELRRHGERNMLDRERQYDWALPQVDT